MTDFMHEYDDYDIYGISFIDYNTYVPDDINLEERFANLTSWQWQQIENFTLAGQLCLLGQWNTAPPKGMCIFLE